MHTAEAVIIGAGVNGTSIAFHLAKAGFKKCIVVERRYFASGATGKSGALVRTNYPNEPETRLAVESLTYFKHWSDLVGGQCGYQPRGLLFLTKPEHTSQLQVDLSMQKKLGVNTQLLTVQEAKEIDPSVALEDVTHAAYEPDSGFADPNATTYSFAQAALSLGVQFWLETTAMRILITNHQVQGVETTRGVIHAPIVVVVAGAWANQLFEPLGIDIGLQPKRGRVAIFRWTHDAPPRPPTYLDRINSLWTRPIDGNCTLIGIDSGQLPPGDPNNVQEVVDQEYIEQCREKLTKRFPHMRYSTMRGNWACALMESPDAHPIIGQLQPYTGLFCMAGDSGTCFKTAPAIGKCLTELISNGQAHTVDLTPFRATRFAEKQPWYDFNYRQIESDGQRTISR